MIYIFFIRFKIYKNRMTPEGHIYILVPVALPHRWGEVLEPTVAKIDDLGLVPIFKKIFPKDL